MSDNTHRAFESDILRIGEDLIPDIDPDLEHLLLKGRDQRVQILEGSESPDRAHSTPYARTSVKITFSNERDLRQCVRLLRWSDDRLRARVEQMILWDWSVSFREGMTIYFGVNWYDKEFFDARRNAFNDPAHRSYYAMFGASSDDFVMEHEIFGGKTKTKPARKK